MITVFYFDFSTEKPGEKQFDNPDDAVEFINKHAAPLFVTGYSCIDGDDAEYINARI